MCAHVTVRPIRLTDAAAYERLASDPAIASLHGMHHSRPVDEGIRVAERALADWQSRTRFTFVVAEGDEARGFAELSVASTGASAKPPERALLGYWMGLPYRSRGLAKRLVRACVGFAFRELRLSAVHAQVLRYNWRSRHVLRATGFVALCENARDDAALIAPSIMTYVNLRGLLPVATLLRSPEGRTALDGYARLYAIPSIPLDENGMSRLRFRDAVEIDIEPARRPDHIHLYTTLCRIPRHADAAWYRTLLEANLFGRDTGYAALACNPQTEEVVLCQLVDLGWLTPERLDLMLQDLVAAATALKQRLHEQQAGGAPSVDRVDTTFMLRI